MPKIGEVEYSEEAFAHMRGLYDAVQAAKTPERRTALLREAETIHELHVQFPGLAWSDVDTELVAVAVEAPVFDAQLSMLEAEKGMALASGAERVQMWKAAARAWVAELPTGTEFTADDLTRAIGLPDAEGSRESPNNVVGAFFSAQAKKGQILFTGRFSKSERVARHSNSQRIWMKAVT